MSHPVLALQRLQHRLAERSDDPAPLVYRRLFEREPALEALFAGDRSGSVRAEMFLRAVETLIALAEGHSHAEGLIVTERINHAALGVDAARFDAFFGLIGEVLRDWLGPAWTDDIDAAWAQAAARAAALSG